MASGELNLHTIPVAALTSAARELLSRLLDSRKVLPSETSRGPRDWRGLAALVGISTEVANSYQNEETAKVLEHWLRNSQEDATIGQLLLFMQTIDRFDVFDDIMELHAKGELFTQSQKQCVEVAVCNNEENILTFDDKIHGCPQFYHAYVLFAPQDLEFVDQMLTRMKAEGLRLCTEHDLLPNFDTPFTPVSRLLSSDRCHRAVLVYSPDFLKSPANQFFMNYAQAVGIEKKRQKIVPVMYRECQLPQQLTFYHKLYYEQPSRPAYDFWVRLKFSLMPMHDTRLNGTANGATNTSLFSSMNITEMNSEGYTNRSLLALPRAPRSTSESGLDQIKDVDSVSNTMVGSHSQGSKKKTLYQKIIAPLRKKKKNHVPVLSG